jgi:hypothetical protein
MSKSIKAKSNFVAHEVTIKRGDEMAFNAWVEIAKEAMDFESVAEYAKVSAKTAKFHSEKTIELYTKSIVNGISHYSGIAKLLSAYDAQHASRNISQLREFCAGLGQRGKSKSNEFSAEKVVARLKANYTPAQRREIKALL